ncbi:hypothetical protein AB1Y20_022774 [Prymnesium parvum]|uniref:HTH cro/C1-type domain-containing protein n=1 Tax=Prymnesium parvum TaxID=97485 RepID=A0AB34JI09_PRYPA
MPADHPLAQLADVAAHLFITLPESPNGAARDAPADPRASSHMLRALRKQLNLTQREFGVLLSPGGASPVSPSVICQFESATHAIPPALLTRALSAATAVQRFFESSASCDASPPPHHHSSPQQSSAHDPSSLVKSLGPGCIARLAPHVDAAGLSSADAALLGEYLAIVSARKLSKGGSRPGARGSYRKLHKLNNFAAPADEALVPTAAALSAAASAGGSSRGESSAGSASLASLSSSRASTPCTTPSSSRGSSRPRSPVGAEAEAAGYAPCDLLLSLRGLQEANQHLLNENKRLRSMVCDEPAGALLEVARGDLAMHC